jgi:hypothetical protein
MALRVNRREQHAEGRWYLGEGGALTVELLARELYDKLRSRAEEKFGRQFAAYQPWMSNPERLGEFEELASSSDRFPPVLTDERVFELLRNVYRSSEAAPLGLLFSEGEWPLDFFAGTAKANREVEVGFGRAKRNVMAVSSAFRRRFAVLNQTIIPVRILKGVSTGRLGFSSPELRGAMFLEIRDGNRPFWDVTLEIDMAHELGNAALMVYQATDALLQSDVAQPVLSPIRKAARPAIMSFHAVAVLGFIVEYLESSLRTGRYEGTARDFAEAELSAARNDLEVGLTALKKCRFTLAGQLIHDELLALSCGTLQV